MAGSVRSLLVIGTLTILISSMVLTAAASQYADDGHGAAPRDEASSEIDWTQFRHDASRTGLTSLNATMRFAYYKWSTRTAAPVYSSPATTTRIDLEVRDTFVLIGSDDGRLYCLNGQNGRLRWRYQATASIFSSPAVGDINGDGNPEVVFGCYDGRIYTVSAGNGTLLWRFTTRAAVYGSPAMADLTGDGIPEVVVGGCDGRVYALKGDGKLLWSAPTPLGQYDTGIYASPTVGDINGDGTPEVVVPAGDWKVYAFSGSDGSELWNHSLGEAIQGAALFSSPALADLDGDGNIEVAVGDTYDAFHCLDGDDGSEKWTVQHLGSFYASPAVGDGDDDGDLEIYIGFSANMVCLNGESGAVEWQRSFPSGLDSSPALADVDGDGRLEIVVGGYDRVVRALNAEDGMPAWAYPCPSGVFSSPAISDIDGDGKAEVVFGCTDGRIYALDYNF